MEPDGNRDLELELTRARERVEDDPFSENSQSRLVEAQRRLAASRGEPWAERLDLGVTWDFGYPDPFLVSNSSTAILLCNSGDIDPEWLRRDRAGEHTGPLDTLEFTFSRCHSVRFGGPNDEAIVGHPLYERGLEGYAPHLVHNSGWIAEEEAISSARRGGDPGGWSDHMNHYFFGFHDDNFEALAEGVTVRTIRAWMADCVADAAQTLLKD